MNVSPIQFAKKGILDDVKQALATNRLSPGRLHLEITESTFLQGEEKLMLQLQELRSMGVQIALDDFGTGYSSLGYVARFPFDKIKIDQSFVRTLAANGATRAIVQSVMALAQGLGLQVVAEGIEGEAETRLLVQMGCEQGQGYYFGKPQAPADFARMIAARNLPLAV